MWLKYLFDFVCNSQTPEPLLSHIHFIPCKRLCWDKIPLVGGENLSVYG